MDDELDYKLKGYEFWRQISKFQSSERKCVSHKKIIYYLWAWLPIIREWIFGKLCDTKLLNFQYQAGLSHWSYLVPSVSPVSSMLCLEYQTKTDSHSNVNMITLCWSKFLHRKSTLLYKSGKSSSGRHWQAQFDSKH